MKVQVQKQWNQERPIFVLIHGRKKITIDLIRDWIQAEYKGVSVEEHSHIIKDAEDARNAIDWLEDDTLE